MEFVDRPIVEFFEHSLSAAYNRGFLWVVTLLAREADVEGLYSNLRKSWASLDSITGEYFLFVFAGKENLTEDERFESKVIDSKVRYYGEYNNYVKFINPKIELEDCYLQSHYHIHKNDKMGTLEENQTIAVNALRDYFRISENEIPCLVFTKLYPFRASHNTIQVIPIIGNDIYGYFKQLFNVIYPLLKEHKDLTVRLKELSVTRKKIEKEINDNTFKGDEKILELRQELMILAENNIVDSNGHKLLDCINNLSYGKFDKPLRSKLNRYIDWVKDYEKRNGKCFDFCACEEKIISKANQKACRKNELLEITQEQTENQKECGKILSEIEEMIRRSKMNGNTRKDSRLSFSVQGDNAQINLAFDNSIVEATQNIGYNENKLTELLENVRNNLSLENTAEDIEVVNYKLTEIKEELKRTKPRKKILEIACDSLKIIKGTVEFGAAVTALIQFVQTIVI